MTILSFGQMVILFVLQLILAREFGTSEEMDAYLAASSIPLMLGGILSGLISTVVVPIYSELRAKHEERIAESAIARLGLKLTIVAALLAGTIKLGSQPLIEFLFSNFTFNQSRQAVDVLETLCWLIPLNAFTGFMFGVEHVRRRFLWPALSGVVGPVVTVGLFLVAPAPTISTLAAVVLFGTLCSVGMLFFHYPKFASYADSVGTSQWKRFWVLSVPLLLGAAYLRIDVFVDRLLAAELPQGSISRMGYSWRIATAVVALGTSGLSIVIFPAFADHASKKDWDALRTDLLECWRFLTFITIPILAGIAVCGKTIIVVLFERGEFTPADSEAVSQMLLFYGGMILAAGIGEISAKTFYAMGKNWVPTLIGMTGFTLGTIVKIGFLDSLHANGLVVVTSLYRLLNATIFLICLWKVGLLRRDSELVKTLMRTAISTTVAVGLGASLMSSGSPLLVLTGVITSVVCYVFLQAILGDEFARRCWNALKFKTP